MTKRAKIKMNAAATAMEVTMVTINDKDGNDDQSSTRIVKGYFSTETEKVEIKRIVDKGRVWKTE